MLTAAPVIAVGIHLAGVTPLAAHGRLLAAETERYWHQATKEPLQLVGCRAADEVIAYAADRPRSLPLRSFRGSIADVVYADVHGWPQRPLPKAWPTELARKGMAMVCLPNDIDWVQAAAVWAARHPDSRRVDIEITRNFLGIAGAPQRYVIFIFPPAR